MLQWISADIYCAFALVTRVYSSPCRFHALLSYSETVKSVTIGERRKSASETYRFAPISAKFLLRKDRVCGIYDIFLHISFWVPPPAKSVTESLQAVSPVLRFRTRPHRPWRESPRFFFFLIFKCMCSVAYFYILFQPSLSSFIGFFHSSSAQYFGGISTFSPSISASHNKYNRDISRQLWIPEYHNAISAISYSYSSP